MIRQQSCSAWFARAPCPIRPGRGAWWAARSSRVAGVKTHRKLTLGTGGVCSRRLKRLLRSGDMRRVIPTDVLTMRRCLALVGAAMSLLLIPAIAAAASPTTSPTPSASTSTSTSGIGLQLGALSLNVPLALNIPGILEVGSAAAETSTPPTSTPPTSGGSSTTPAPPTSSHQSTPTTSQPRTTSATPPPPPPNTGSVFPPPTGGNTSSSPSHPSSSHPTSTPASTSSETKGTGSFVLTQRLLGNSGEVMIAALLAATAIAVIAFARLGGVRRGRRTPREH